MSTPLVTEQSVHAAADTLKAEGKTVSYRAVADRIGGGSHRDLKIHLGSWWAKEAQNPSAAASAATTAVEVDKYLREATTKIEGVVQRRLVGEVARIRAESENASRVAAAQLDGAAEDISGLQDEVDGLKAQLADAQVKLEAERQRAQSLTSALSEERVQLSIVTAVEHATQQRVNDLKDAQSALVSEIAAERAMNASLRERERHLRDELERARSSATTAQQQAVHLHAENEASNQRQHEIEASLKAQLDAGMQRLQESQAALTEAREHAARLQGELDGIRSRRDGMPAVVRPHPSSATKGKAAVAGDKTTAS